MIKEKKRKMGKKKEVNGLTLVSFVARYCDQKLTTLVFFGVAHQILAQTQRHILNTLSLSRLSTDNWEKKGKWRPRRGKEHYSIGYFCWLDYKKQWVQWPIVAWEFLYKRLKMVIFGAKCFKYDFEFGPHFFIFLFFFYIFLNPFN